MSVEVITDALMVSSTTPHRARCVGGDLWVVSYLPGRTVSGEQAMVAMALASTVGKGAPAPADPSWGQLEDWASQLGLTAREATGLVAAECLTPNTFAKNPFNESPFAATQFAGRPAVGVERDASAASTLGSFFRAARGRR